MFDCAIATVSGPIIEAIIEAINVISTASTSPTFGHGTHEEKRTRMMNAGKLHWLHWFVLLLSLALTTSTWLYARAQVNDRNQSSFDREADLIVALITERMQKYEDALRGGVGAINLHNGAVDAKTWKRFSDTLKIDQLYPGINGIGVIVAMPSASINAFESSQRIERPDFQVHPRHSNNESMPILTVEPVAANRSAVGLDIAHETNRYTAAQLARDTASSQITGPIVLVQDEANTPGFLFYLPFYRTQNPVTVEERREAFLGMVYAPFVVKKLMAGTLAHSKRHVSLRISDDSEVIFDELTEAHPESDPDPMFSRQVELSLYGRTWTMTIQSNQLFRKHIDSNEHYLILVTGIIIDALLLFLFLALVNSNRRAVEFADEMTLELKADKKNLERSNSDLEQFANIASHDLQEPLRMVGNFTQLLQKRYAGKLDDTADSYINYSVEGVSRMQNLLHDLLQYARVGQQQSTVPTDSQSAFDIAKNYLAHRIEQDDAILRIDTLPNVMCNETQMVQLFQNLLSNALKFRKPDVRPVITVSAEKLEDEWQFNFQDNGIGIEPEYRDQIFLLFKRLHEKDSYPGTGLGLATCRKIVTQHGGHIWIETAVECDGVVVCFTLPDVPTELAESIRQPGSSQDHEPILAA